MRRPSLLHLSAWTTLAATVAFTSILSSPSAGAPSPRPTFINAWRSLYPGSISDDNVDLGVGSECQLCHQDANGGDGWNPYGWRIREFMVAGNGLTDAILMAEPFDSDQDPTGSTTLEEISANSQPGWTPGPNNTITFDGGSTSTNQLPPAAILGKLDPNTGSAFCFGDGTGTGCPCGGNGNPGEGCANTSGSGGAVLTASGSACFGDDSFQLSVTGIPGAKAGLCVKGSNPLGGGNGNPVGDGLLCAGPQLRSQVIISNSNGELTMNDWRGQPFSTFPNAANMGSTTYYQWWYRDPMNPCSGQGFNFTNAWSVDWQ